MFSSHYLMKQFSIVMLFTASWLSLYDETVLRGNVLYCQLAVC